MVKSTGVTQATDKVRLGKFTECYQPHNSIVLNASNTKIDNIEHSGFYVSPIRNTPSSNLLAYDSTTKEIVDIGGHKLKISSLEVENLDVVNSNTVHNYYVDNPVFEIAKGCPRVTEDVGIVMHRANGNVDIKFSEKENHLSINKDLAVDGAVKAKIFEGDAGLLSNVQFHFEVGDTFENLNVTGQLKADGGLLSNISVQQLQDLGTSSLDLENVFIHGSLRTKNPIYSQSSVIAPYFVGDGTKLEGVVLKEEFDANMERVRKIEDVLPTIKDTEREIQRVEAAIPQLEPLEDKINEVRGSIPSLTPMNTRVVDLEKYAQYVKEKIQTIDRKFKDIKPPETVDLSPIEKNIIDLKSELTILENDINSKLKKIKMDIPVIPEIPDLTDRVNHIDSKLENIFKALEDSIHSVRGDFPRHIRVASQSLDVKIQQSKNRIHDIENKLPRFEGLIPDVRKVERDIVTFKETIPKINSRLKTIEDYVPPPITLQSVTECESNTACHVSFENVDTSVSTHGNVGIGTDVATSRVTIYKPPDITSILGEVPTIKINELAEINAYTKANAGLSSGRPGGIVFKTKRPNGGMQDSMTIDGNGHVTIGSSTAHKCASVSINSTLGGLLLPRLTTEQIENIRKPEPGLMVYDTEKDTFMGYKKSGWTELC